MTVLTHRSATIGAIIASIIVLGGAGALFAQNSDDSTGERVRDREHMPTLATTRTASNSSEEDIIAKSDDSSLERSAKLRRAWNVYREIGGDAIYAIGVSSTKHQIMTLDFFTAFDSNYKVKIVPEGALDEYETGNPITDASVIDPEEFQKSPRRCRLVRSEEDPAVYLVCGDKKRVIIREGAFHQNGWEFRDVEVVPEEQIDELEDGEAVTEVTVFDEDVEVDTTEMRETRERLSKRMSLQGKDQVRDRLVKGIGDSDVYLITADGQRRHVKDEETANRLGLDLRKVTEVPLSEVEAFEEGDEVDEDTPEEVVEETVEE